MAARAGSRPAATAFSSGTTWRNIIVGLITLGLCFTIATFGVSVADLVKDGKTNTKTHISQGISFTTVYSKSHGAIELVVVEADIGVIGTGPSGGIVMEKASRDLTTSVFGIDKGANFADDRTLVYLDNNRDVLASRWDYIGTPGKSRPVAGFGGRTQEIQVSNVMGGDAYINNANVVRASDGWRKKAYAVSGNNPNMDPANILAHSKAVEHFMPITPGATTNRGTTGPIGIVEVPVAGPMPMAAKWVTGFNTVSGTTTPADYNRAASATPDWGFSDRWQMFGNADGTRSYTFSHGNGILNENAVERCGPDGRDYCGIGGRRLKVWGNSEATKLIFDTTGDRPRCVGFHFTRNGVPHVFRARKAVALHAGLLSSRLLQISGVGDSAILNPLGIETVVHLPNVGKRWSNHVAYSYTLSSPSTERATDNTNGNFTCTMGGFFPNPYNTSDPLRVIQILLQDGNSATNTPVTTVKAMTVFHLQPKSRGSQIPMSASLNGPWNVTYGYFDDPDDINTLLKFHNETILPLKAYMAGAGSSAFAGYAWTNPSPTVMDDPAQMRAFLVSTARHAHHGCELDLLAPCANGGVVDPDTGLVCGTDGLFHIDTSVVIQPDGNNEHYVLTVADIYADVAVNANWWA